MATLYKATIEFEMMILADSEGEARELAEENAVQEIQNQDLQVEIYQATYIPHGWEDALPYCDPDKNPEEKDCTTLFAELTASRT